LPFSACINQSRTIKKVATVSAVDPDLATTTTSVFREFMLSSAALAKAGSKLSRITKRGCAGLNVPCTGYGPRIPQSSAHAPSALPPMPARHTVSKEPRTDSA
jgi:hypothetical protein